ncbi:MAG TPA: FliH/SctL family protein [Xanthomonadaceae bacterium]|jgi:flagellar biosynthesis/type III secretory pathway protein FliH
MERIHASDVRFAGWADRMAERDEEARLAVPDPRIQLETERALVLEAARAEGQKQGLQHADAEVHARAQAVERDIAERHAAESAKLVSANDQMKALLRGLPDAMCDADARIEHLAVEIAYTALVRLLSAAAVERPLITSVCAQALTECRQRPVVVRVAPSDAAALSECIDDDGVRVVADQRLRPGQCQLETHKGLYETGLEVRLESLKLALLSGLGSAEEAAA